MMIMIMLFLVYLIQLMFNYFVLRAVYIKNTFMIDGFVFVVGLIPFIGFLIGLLYFPYGFNGYSKKKILDFIFMVKKA